METARRRIRISCNLGGVEILSRGAVVEASREEKKKWLVG